MDARAGTFQALELFGQQLLQGGHYAAPDIQEKLNHMADARQDLEKYDLIQFEILRRNISP